MLHTIRRKMRPLTLSEALEYVQDISADNVSTDAWYQTPVNMLMEITGDIPVTKITSRHIREWQKVVEHEPSEKTGKVRSLHTQDSYKRSLHALINHLIKARHLPRNCSLNDEIRFKRLPYPKAKSLPDEDVKRILQAAKKSKRDYAMVHVLRASGIRVGGLHSMRMSEIEIVEVDMGEKLSGERQELVELAKYLDLVDMIQPHFVRQFRGRFLVEEKATVGQKNVRWARLDHDACTALMAYMEIRPRIGTEPVWLNRNQRPISQNGIYVAFKRVCGRAGVDASPHDLRHTFCRRLLSMGIDLNTVAKLSGHRSITTLSRVYGVARDDEADAAYERFARHNGSDSQPRDK